ncbi:saccharopine dehydrogenase family protein [Robertkochia sediminum]|uniref:saccharopine dehydrogenase family protein n=1 Tax=Robertkochia sediminum TaxID=2785326 RepID=UPI00193469B4|nr:saccharopine dehydrogenase family protein [Robertkochia sediminum]MBL7473835.1 saccharopine dehydrogenase NADP-binding domain-containing protein [Robertkochia sediminum]
MNKILIFGAGKSTSYLIPYLLEKGAAHDLQLTIADINLENAQKACMDSERCQAVKLDIFAEEERGKAIASHDLVISMLPARLHINIARDCLKYEKHMVTASYVSAEMEALHEEAQEKGLLFLNEIGVDPGIDHMSAMQVIDQIRSKGGKMLLFESFTGGLVAPESDNNLWNYKFTWNPRNVVVAGQGGVAKFIQEGKYKYIPYNKLFRRTEFMEIEGYGWFEGYANRDSLKYRDAYGLQDALTLYRGTMRRVGYSRAWNMFVQLGMTDDSFTLEGSEDMTYREFVNAFLPYSPTDSIELKLRHYLKIDQDDIMWQKLVDLDLFSNTKTIGIMDATPAQALQKILEEKWTLDPEDKDMIVMYHKFGYEINGVKKQLDSHMVVIGKDQRYTAMSKTVGLPVGIATLQILKGNFKLTGVRIPIYKEIYDPVMKELKEYDIEFSEFEVPYLGYNPDNVAG